MAKYPKTPLKSAAMKPMSLGENKYTLPQADGISQRTPPVDAGKLEVPKKTDKKVTKVGTTVLADDGYTPRGYVRMLAEDGSHLTVGEGSHKLSNYELPVCETDKERRSFPGWNVMELDGPEMDSVSWEGTTETRGGRSNNKAYAYSSGPTLHRRFK